MVTREQFLSNFKRDTEEGYKNTCAILGVGPDFIPVVAVQIVPDCLTLPLGLREYGYCRWNGILLGLELATLFEVHKVRIAEDGTIHFAPGHEDLKNLYGFKGWTEKIVQPPAFDYEDPDGGEQLWRKLLRWRWEKYEGILRAAGDLVANHF
jgi:hypothetical protein